jgi:glyoxylase-like metal-dependent hydrolase (beta-lactamase superfamily II)
MERSFGRHHRLSRRLFLSELGRRTFAVTVLGAVAAACSSDDTTPSESGAGAASGSTEATSTGSSQANDSTNDSDQANDQDGEGQALRWERANFGFVSAYVLARGDEVAVVDTGTGSITEIEQALGALSLGWADVDHVIVTHAHGDHIGGLDAVLTAAESSTGYAGVGDVEQLSAPRDLVAVSGGDEVFGLEILATPGHTPGHISPYDPATGLLVAGDALITEGGTLLGPSEQFSSDIDLARESVKAIADTPVGTILVGHGDPISDGADQLPTLAEGL